ncbi:hypothetical protein H6G04_21165 [Calothrix membranacea FACHB-236]|nr:hypothetical protein [Calothrix membranacea FACHB-236]
MDRININFYAQQRDLIMLTINKVSLDELRKIFTKNDFYNRYYKGSYLQKLYIHIFRRDLLAENKKVLQFNQSILAPNSLVFDIGANVGYKANIYLKIGCQVIAVEPDPRNIKVLRRLFKNNKKLTLVQHGVNKPTIIVRN